MADLIERLRAAIDEDEALAEACDERHWRWDGANSSQVYTVRKDGSNRTIARCANGYDDDYSNSRHIARHDPARVLRQCERYRVLLDNAAQALVIRAHGTTDPAELAEAMWADDILNGLAAIYGIETESTPRMGDLFG